RFSRDWSSDVCSSDLKEQSGAAAAVARYWLGQARLLFSLALDSSRPQHPLQHSQWPVTDSVLTALRFVPPASRHHAQRLQCLERSEERRGGKDGRSRW